MNAQLFLRLLKLRNSGAVFPSANHASCPVCVASRQARTGAVSVGDNDEHPDVLDYVRATTKHLETEE